MRKFYGALLAILLLCFLGFTGCTGNAASEVMSNGQSAVAEETVIDHTFAHHRFVDNLFMTLPPDWTYSTYEKVNAGDEMENHEWGFKVYIKGKPAGEIIISGGYESGEPADGEGTDFITNTGLLAKRYTQEAEDENKDVLIKEYIALTVPGFDYAYYAVTCTISKELYEDNKEILDSFLMNVGVAAVPIDTQS